MNNTSFSALAKHIDKHLFWFGIINLLVGFKLIASFIWPGLQPLASLS
jgi:hypothetical protein